VFRAELAHRTRRSIQEIDELPLREVVALLGGRTTHPNGPPETPPPGRREISGADVAALPRWARAAFAARCARRMQPMLAEVAPQAPPEELEQLDQAITLAEQSAAEGAPAPGIEGMVTVLIQRAQRAKTAQQPPAGQTGVIAPSLVDLLRVTVNSAAVTAA